MASESSSKVDSQPPMGGDTVVRHLLADGQPPRFVELAHLYVRLGEHVYACNAHFLARLSQLICETFTSTARQGWASGIAALIQGHREENWTLLLAMIHGTVNVQKMRASLGMPRACVDWDELEDLLQLAHKLDAPVILQACEAFAQQQDHVTMSSLGLALQTVTLASTLGLKNLRRQCLNEALGRLIGSQSPLKAMEEMNDLKGGWEAVLFEDYHTLFLAVLTALGDLKSDFERCKCDFDSYYRRYGSSDQFVPKFKPDDVYYCNGIFNNLPRSSP